MVARNGRRTPAYVELQKNNSKVDGLLWSIFMSTFPEELQYNLDLLAAEKAARRNEPGDGSSQISLLEKLIKG